MKKCSIELVDNGFILKVLNEGVSELKTSYDKPILVFKNLEFLFRFLRKHFPEEMELSPDEVG